MRLLIVNADDLGIHPGVNDGVIHAHLAGIVTGASIVTNGEAFDHALRALQRAPDLDVGVHLTLVGETPVSSPERVRGLAPQGRLPRSYGALFRRLFLGRIPDEELKTEIEAQLSRARDAGLNLSHIDSHQHVHLHPAIFPLAAHAARRFGVRAVRAARRVVPVRQPRAAVLAPFARHAHRQARHAGLITADTFLGMAETGGLDEKRLLRLIERIPKGTSELVCHPGVGDGAIGSAYRWGFRWDEETRALTSADVRGALVKAGVRLIRFADL
ncbi:MAG: ChbG/HpnK family deacetylase [Vicinamibacteria bacterium]|nr:ChbG/HpnK family deacetylase [Vicinamibacteria bacterium]